MVGRPVKPRSRTGALIQSDSPAIYLPFALLYM